MSAPTTPPTPLRSLAAHSQFNIALKSAEAALEAALAVDLRLLPHGQRPAIKQARLDLRKVVDELQQLRASV